MNKKTVFLFLTLLLIIFLFACDNNTNSELFDDFFNESNANLTRKTNY
jgi:hypothetical protein